MSFGSFRNRFSEKISTKRPGPGAYEVKDCISKNTHNKKKIFINKSKRFPKKDKKELDEHKAADNDEMNKIKRKINNIQKLNKRKVPFLSNTQRVDIEKLENKLVDPGKYNVELYDISYKLKEKLEENKIAFMSNTRRFRGMIKKKTKTT